MHTESIHPAVRVGHVHLRVAAVDRAIAFYRDGLGFNLTAEARRDGLDTAFLAAGDYHHHIGLSTCPSADGSPLPDGRRGLHHVALLYPGRRELARAITRLLDHGHRIDHGTDYGSTVSVYVADADGHRIELYYDRPREDWFGIDGRPVLRAERFHTNDLIRTARTRG